MNDELTEMLGGKQAIRELSADWHGIPDELSESEKKFMEKHRLAFSSGYIGMLRCYRDDPKDKCRYARTVWQSSSGLSVVASAVLKAEDEPFPPPGLGESLRQAGREFLKGLMDLSEPDLAKALDRNVGLF